MENYTMTPADIASVTGGNTGFGGMGGGWLLIVLFLLVFGGNGFGFGGNRGSVATTEDVANGFNFSALQGKTNDILAAVNGVNQNLANAICQSSYQTAQDINALARQLADCCCTTQRAIDSVKFDMANYAAATSAAITASTQKILDKMCADQTAALYARVQSLELQNALCGVVRYPTAMTYATNCNPFAGYNCGTCSNI